MNVFVLNCGSSSLKFQIIETDPELIEHDGDRQLAKGLIERVGSEAIITLQVGDHPPLKQARAAARPPGRAGATSSSG